MEVEPCPCGAKADIAVELNRGYCVCCSVDSCWVGPTRESEAEAIAAWNRVAGERWRSIETAPMDSKSRLIWVPEVQCEFMVSWQDQDDPPYLLQGWYIFGSGGWMPVLQNATHWRPLPEPPEKAA